MAFVIAEPRIDHMDQSCVAACPVDCIAGDPSVGPAQGATRVTEVDPARVRVYACGSGGMVAASRAVLERAGVPPKAISWESFTPPRAPAA